VPEIYSRWLLEAEIQLGLELKPSHVFIGFLVIDQVEQPPENEWPQKSLKCMVRRATAREKRRIDRQVCANVFGLQVERSLSWP
jgi:hypothetical protein